MKIALIGATGFVGNYILKEALNRGYEITGISRHPERLPEHKNLEGIKADIMDVNETSKILKGHDVVISAFNPGWDNPDIYDLYIKGINSILNELKNSGIKRFIIIGGAGSLEIKPGVQLVDTPDFPKEYKEGALAARDVLLIIKKKNDLDWTFLSPSILLQPGKRTGNFRYGTDQVLFDKNGESKISVQDLAVAIVDEIENPRYIKKRFTVGY